MIEMKTVPQASGSRPNCPLSPPLPAAEKRGQAVVDDDAARREKRPLAHGDVLDREAREPDLHDLQPRGSVARAVDRGREHPADEARTRQEEKQQHEERGRPGAPPEEDPSHSASCHPASPPSRGPRAPAPSPARMMKTRACEVKRPGAAAFPPRGGPRAGVMRTCYGPAPVTPRSCAVHAGAVRRGPAHHEGDEDP